MVDTPSGDGPAGLPPVDLATDPTLRRALQVARAWGVAPGRFLGRESVRRTVYERAPDGRILAAVEYVEGWSENDRALALALADYEADCCTGCGHPLADTTRPEAEDEYLPGDAIRCHFCTAAYQLAAIHAQAPHRDALRFTVRRAAGAVPVDDHQHPEDTNADRLDPAGP